MRAARVNPFPSFSCPSASHGVVLLASQSPSFYVCVPISIAIRTSVSISSSVPSPPS